MKIVRTDLNLLLDTLGVGKIPIAISKLQGPLFSSIADNKLVFKKDLSRSDLNDTNLLKHDCFYVFITAKEKKLLKRRLPHLFFPIDFTIALSKAEDLLKKVDFLNTLVPHDYQRKLVFAENVLKPTETEAALLVKTPVILHAASHEELTLNNLPLLQKNLAAHPTLPLSLAYKEKGVLVFNEENSTNFAMFTDLITMLKQANLPYAVITKTTAFMPTFTTMRPRLCILTYSGESHKTKSLYVHLKRRDPLAKILEIDALKHETSQSLYQRIQTLYYADYFDAKSGIKLQKTNLDPQKELHLKTTIANLKQNYNSNEHAELEYVIQRLGLRYNIDHLMFSLNKFRHH
ncbi:hypothetical protein COTS27_00395 [Spirochaetota bacterium]|nr:hypothetical protein COTS27_00395 [Spirochaetota bacterium]